jgi:uncharacterized cupredoxin-like copper-binding protein
MIVLLLVSCTTNNGNEIIESAANSSNASDDSDTTEESESTEEGEHVHVEVIGQDLLFEPNEVVVNQGDTVHMTFVNEGAIPHDFTLHDFDVKTEIISGGESSELVFVAEKKGEFQFICSVPGHAEAGMTGTLIVK